VEEAIEVINARHVCAKEDSPQPRHTATQIGYIAHWLKKKKVLEDD
jgi:hypothetical protein